MSKKIAIIRIRGLTGIKTEISDTLDQLRLYKKNNCVVVVATPSILGMIMKVKDYVTYGEVSEEVYKKLIDEKGEEFTDRTQDSKGRVQYKKYIKVGDKLIKPTFRLSPPVGGFERKGIKQPFTTGGVLGNRKDKINELILKMI